MNETRLLNTSWRTWILLLCLGLVSLYWFLLKSPVLADTALREKLEWPNTDFSKTAVDLKEILSGGPPKDGIPAIDEPHFIDISSADQWLDPQEPVIVLKVQSEVRAYPIQIMIYHEIVNDVVGGLPVAVTFCPLCNATIVFDRRVNGQILDFGTTGKLRKSDMVMYDRQTESWWQQFIGTGIVGEYAGVTLKQIPAQIVAYQDLRKAYPKAQVLSFKTGHSRPYGRNPYRGYDQIDNTPFLLMDKTDKRLAPMERVIFIRKGKQQRLYPFSMFKERPVINDVVAGMPVVIFSKKGTLSALDASEIIDSRTIPSATAWSRRVDGRELNFTLRQGKLIDIETGSHWDLFGLALSGLLAGQQLDKVDSGVHFAFAWLAFNPDTEIYAP
ncbi:MAG: DUF3179 domain-containing protein [Gammaproteobacteria bacterium]|nr:DUF3179 domain-containing protein [Gammaproteobacteria bacterium]